ncbi:MAG: hypothetical protein DRP00_04620 [Candidatus Aenigmatarchaeota archaeon]|nr:MAG: hypothetical protein DRP00_04620 [Candidatus Aenigmarchaeota archaeon]
MSAGYGIEENYPFIKRNLSERYGLGKIALEAIISFLKESVYRMRKVNYDVYFWRDAIKDYVRGKHLVDFIEWYSSMYERLSERKKLGSSSCCTRYPRLPTLVIFEDGTLASSIRRRGSQMMR